MKIVIQRFLNSGMSMEEVSAKMDVSVEDLSKLLNGLNLIKKFSLTAVIK